MTQTLVSVVAAFMYLLREPSAAALVIALGVFLNLPYILPAYHDLDFVLAALLALAAGTLRCTHYLGTLRAVAPRDYAAAIFIWLASTLVSVAFSNRPDIAYEVFRTVLPYVVLSVMLVALVTDLKTMSLLFSGLIVATSGLALLALVQWTLDLGHLDFGGLAIGELAHISGDITEIRPGGPVEDANFFAAYLLPGTILALARFFAVRQSGTRIFYAVAAVLSMAGIFLTASRGALGALGLGLVLLLLLERKIWPWVTSAVLALVLVSAFPPAYVERFGQTFSLASVQQSGAALAPIEDEALAGRLGSMIAAAQMFARQPLTGVGYGQYETNFQTYVAQHDLRMRNEDRGAHSLYLEIASETGVIGLAAFGIVLLLGARNMGRLASALRQHGDHAAYLDVRGYAVAIITLLAAHTFLHDAKAHYIWLFVSLMYASPRTSRRPPRQEPQVDPRNAVSGK